MEIINDYFDTGDGHKIHIAHLPVKEALKQPILFIHGAIEDGSIFYSKKGKGLAPFLQAAGHPCFVLDMRGKGKSTPPISPQANYGQLEFFDEDLPKALDHIHKLYPNLKVSLITHSWGGVLANAFLLMNPQWVKKLGPIIHFASKRRVSVLNFHRFFFIDVMWLMVGTLFLWIKGYLPKGVMGPEGETKKSLKESQQWVYSHKWLIKERGIDLQELAKRHKLPPTLYLTGSKDYCLGHIKDVTAFALESGHKKDDIRLLSKKSGNLEDYDHLSILISKKAPQDHFLTVRDFLTLSD